MDDITSENQVQERVEGLKCYRIESMKELQVQSTIALMKRQVDRQEVGKSGDHESGDCIIMTIVPKFMTVNDTSQGVFTRRQCTGLKMRWQIKPIHQHKALGIQQV